MAAPKKNPYSKEQIAGEALTVAVGGLGAALFLWLHIPGGAMSGSVVAVAALAALGRATAIGDILRNLSMAAIGVSIGSVVGPDTFSRIATYPATMALMAVCVAGMTFASAAVWRYYMGWPRSMSVLASVPGAMSYIVTVAMTMGADAAKVAVAQMSRVIFLVTLLPFIIVWEEGGHFTPYSPDVVDPLPILALTFAAGFGVGLLFTRFKISGGMILGSLAASAVIHVSGLAPGRAPAWLMNGGQVLLGAWVGSRFVDFDWSLFLRIITGTALAVGAALATSIAFALIASRVFGVPFGAALIGFAPGGQEAMVVLALALGADPVFVATHHLARYFLINATLPFLIAWMRRSEAQANRGE